MQRRRCTDVVVVVPGIMGSALAVDGLDPGPHRVRTQAATGGLPVTSTLLVWEEAP